MALDREEGAASVLAEIAPFCGDKELITAVYSALRETVTPAGRLKNVQNLSAPNEYVRALRLAFALKAAGRRLCEGDSRYKHLVEWLAKNVNDRVLEPHDVAFATFVLLELPMPSNSDT